MGSSSPEKRKPRWSIRIRASERAVTPVIGIILMVAIAVILATVIGTFAFNLYDKTQDFAPSTRFTFKFDSTANGESCGLKDDGGPNQGELKIIHESGEKINEEQLTVIDDEGNEASWNACTLTPVSELTAGSTANPDIDSDDTIRLVWKSENKADDTVVLAKFKGPDA